jgi:hypothetical protein
LILILALGGPKRLAPSGKEISQLLRQDFPKHWKITEFVLNGGLKKVKLFFGSEEDVVGPITGWLFWQSSN